MIGAALRMNNISSAKADFSGSAAALREPHLWLLSLLYIGTFGSFIGFASVFPKLIADQFPAFSSIAVGTAAVSLAFLGALVGSLARPIGGRLADRFGGARVTIGVFAAMAIMTLAVMAVIPTGQFWLFLGCFLLLFAAAGAGNGSTYRMVPVVFALRGSGDAATGGDVSSKRKAAAALGLISAIGAYGGFLIPQALNLSKLGTGSYTGAFFVFVLAYVALHGPHGTPLRPQAQRRIPDLTPMTDTTTGVAASTDTHCPYCALQCAMTLTRADGAAEGAAPVVVAGRDFPTNRGGLCKKGWTSAELLRSPDRLTAPLVRGADGELHETEWDAALDLIADRLRSIRAAHGADAVAVFGGGGLTNEKAYQLGKFARLALGTSRIDYNGRFCMSSAAAAGNRAFGIDRGMPFPLSDLDAASTVLLLGTNVAATMPPFIGHLTGAQDAGGLIVVDPRRTATVRLTDEGRGIHLQPTPGTDLALLLGLTHVVIAEGLADETYLAERTDGVDGLRRSVAGWWPERVQSVTGVPATTIRAVARRLAAGDGVYILTGRGVEQHVDGTDTATAAINLALALGLPGRADSGYGTLTGQGNGQGGREHGQKCDQLPGYRKITDPDARAHVAAVWGVDPAVIPGAGIPAVELLQALGTDGRAEGAARARIQRRRLGAERIGGAGRARAPRPARRVGLLPLRDRGPGGCRSSRCPSGPRRRAR